MGRELELRRLRAALGETLSGRGTLVLLSGEPGIGKTRLAGELVAHARRRRARIAWANCLEGDGAPPFWPWVQLIRDLGRPGSREPEPARELGSRTGHPARDPPPLPSLGPIEGDEARLRLFEGVTAFLKEAAEAQPLVLVLDDLHWADAPSLLLLRFLASELRACRLLVLCTYRDLEVGPEHPLTRSLGELAALQHLPLAGLSEPEVGALIASLIGASPSTELVEAVCARSGGNPFFVNELVWLLNSQQAGGTTPSPSTIPEGVRGVIVRRLDGLSPACREILTTASVIGQEFRLVVLALTARLDQDRLLRLLDEARAARIVAESTAGRYAFSHPLVRETLYESLDSPARLALHRCVGEALEKVFEDDLEPHLAELALHFLQAAPTGSDVAIKALRHSQAAGEGALGALAYEEAVRHFRRALDVMELAGGIEEGRRCELMLLLGEALMKAGEGGDARKTFSRAAESARARGEADQVIRAALGFGAGARGFRGSPDEPLVALLEEALAALEGRGDDAARARVLGGLATQLHYAGILERAERLSEEAVETARRLDDAHALGMALSSRMVGMFGQDAQRWFGVVEELLQLGGRIGDKEIVLRARIPRVRALLEQGDVAEVDTEIERVARLAEELRQPSFLWFPAFWRAMRALMVGRFEDAERLSAEALEIGRHARPDHAKLYFTLQMFSLRRAQGRPHEVEDLLRTEASMRPGHPVTPCFVALLDAEMGRLPQARGEFERVASDGFAWVANATYSLYPLGLLAEVCVLLGDAPRAAMLYERLLPYRGRFPSLGHGPVCNGSLSRSLGLLAHTLGRWEQATWHFEESLQENARIGSSPWVAQTQYDYARLLLDRGEEGDSERARELAEKALGTYRGLGVQEHARRAEALLGSAPVPVPPAGRQFRREGDFWTISYGGRTIRLKDSKGLRDLAVLLAHPGREIHVVDLVAGFGSPVRADASSAVDLSVDARARAQYRTRLEELREDLEEAEQSNDAARAALAREEIDAIATHLAAAYGIGQRPRRFADATERARKSVTRRLRYSMARLEREHPALGRHLRRAVRTGVFCSYMPEELVSWSL